MPCIRCKGGYKIQRSKGGLYPKIYPTLSSCKSRAGQMETFKHIEAKSELEKVMKS